MDDLRSEIRAAFQEEQEAHPPLGGLRSSLTAAASSHQHPAHNFQWVAIAVAALLGILVVAGLASTRLGPRASLPAATPAGPLDDYGAPPAGVPLLYVHDPNHQSWLIGYDWSGKPRGTVKLDSTQASPRMAPDGQSFAIGMGGKGGTDKILDRLGSPVAGTGVLPSGTTPIWADDYKHICGMTFDHRTFAWTLITLMPGHPVKSVAVIGRDTSIGQTAISLVSCSVHNDQAITVRTTVAWPSELWVVQLSSGKVLTHSVYTDSSVISVVGSSNGVLVAENAPQSAGQEFLHQATWTTVLRLSDRSIVARLDPSLGVVAFNSDDSLALVTTEMWVGGSPTHLAVIDLRTGHRIWEYDGPDMLDTSLSQPGGRDFALVLRAPNSADLVATEVIVHGDGSTTRLPGRYIPTW
jgi:hypothetical protein